MKSDELLDAIGEAKDEYVQDVRNAKVKKIAECHSAQELISFVLNSCPNYIDVYINTNNDSEAVSFLSNVFTNRLKIYSKN